MEGGVKTEAIKQIRLAKGIGQAELGRRIGVTGAAVLAMESPGRYPEANKLPAIADALDCTIDALFGRDQDGGSPAGGASPSPTL